MMVDDHSRILWFKLNRKNLVTSAISNVMLIHTLHSLNTGQMPQGWDCMGWFPQRGAASWRARLEKQIFFFQKILKILVFFKCYSRLFDHCNAIVGLTLLLYVSSHQQSKEKGWGVFVNIHQWGLNTQIGWTCFCCNHPLFAEFTGDFFLSLCARHVLCFSYLPHLLHSKAWGLKNWGETLHKGHKSQENGWLMRNKEQARR